MDFKKFNLYITALKLPLDVIAIYAGFVLAYYIRYKNIGIRVTRAMPFDSFNLIILFIIVVWLIVFALSKLYEFRKRAFIEEFGITVVAISAGMMVLFTILFFTNNNSFSRLIIGYSWIFTSAFVVFFRAVLRIIEKVHYLSDKGKIKVLLIGSDDTADEIFKSYNVKGSRYKIIGVLNDQNNNNIKLLGKASDYQKIIEQYKIDEVVQTDQNLDKNLTESIINYCHLNGIGFKFISSISAIRSKNIIVEAIGGIPVIEIRRSPLAGWGRIAKRIMDIIGSIIAIIIASPLMLVVSIVIKLDSKGPVLFKQRRVGANNKEFIFMKFRSMYTGAHKEHEKMIKKYGNMFKLKDDPRVTRFGRFLRKTSIDELPQFFNVFKGEMSLVGPRPPMPEEVSRYSEWQKKRVGFKPGVTGLWQVSGRSDTSFEEWVKLDVYYIENWSLLLDLHIILKTFFVIFTKRGAY
jgi:exopolysaccharide biosynthesis polyprenyl glycosylphosphotransferase